MQIRMFGFPVLQPQRERGKKKKRQIKLMFPATFWVYFHEPFKPPCLQQLLVFFEHLVALEAAAVTQPLDDLHQSDLAVKCKKIKTWICHKVKTALWYFESYLRIPFAIATVIFGVRATIIYKTVCVLSIDYLNFSLGTGNVLKFRNNTYVICIFPSVVWCKQAYF